MKNNSFHNAAIISRLTRRQAIGFLGGTAATTLLGCTRKPANSTAVIVSPIASPIASPSQPAAVVTAAPSCVVRPQQTAGPYFIDDKLDRADVRSDPATGAVSPGVPLQLIFQVSQISNGACLPLGNATVDIWHCDAAGIYSGVNDRNFNTIGSKFLRGYQSTDTSGMAKFVTIYPGWYPGRAVHIHFKIRTQSENQPDYEFTSQLYFDDALSDRVFTQAPYAARGQRSHTNSQDGIFRNGGEQLLLKVDPAETGYVAKFEIGLDFT